MKREILFRAKKWISGEWLEGEVHLKCNNAHIHTNYADQYKIDEDTIGQFTGMTDKNGTKIFEGDIVKEQCKSHEIIYNVFWDEDYFAFRVKSKDYSYYLDELVSSHCEVIGNVFENNELLK